MRLERSTESSNDNQSREYKIRLTEPQRRWAEHAIAEVMGLEFEAGETLPYLDGLSTCSTPNF